MNISLIAIDLAKTTFQVCGVNPAGKSVFNRSVQRAKLAEFITQHPGAPIAMEACSGSNYWGRRFRALGHQVILIPPQHVKPFVKGNKNDRNDAFAISEAARRPDMRTVAPRSLEQTDLILAHRIRQRRVGSRTALTNQIRGFLNEYGIVLPQGLSQLQRAIPRLLEDAGNGLTCEARYYLDSLHREWRALNEQIKEVDQSIARAAKRSEATQRLLEIRGVGALIATAAIAKLGDGKQYRNGRQFSACLGLVPKEHSSGGKQLLGGITKRGDEYLRRMLVQGAWSVLRYADQQSDRLSLWARQVVARRGKHKAALAVANKLARIIWAITYHERRYVPA